MNIENTIFDRWGAGEFQGNKGTGTILLNDVLDNCHCLYSVMALIMCCVIFNLRYLHSWVCMPKGR